MSEQSDDLLDLLNSRGAALNPGSDDWDDVVSKYLSGAASQAREQALLEMETAVHQQAERDLEESKKATGLDHQAYPTVLACLPVIEALTTPEAQAQAQRRIVAWWLEEQRSRHGGMVMRFQKAGDKDALKLAVENHLAAASMLAALKEQE